MQTELRRIWCVALTLVLASASASAAAVAQEAGTGVGGHGLDAQGGPPSGGVPVSLPEPENPFRRRPQCATMFLNADRQLTARQRACDWLQQRMFSTGALTGALFSAGSSMVLDRPTEAGDPFRTRFARKWSQSAMKSTAAYIGGFVFREDPRARPPYLSLLPDAPPRGFVRRLGRALAGNVMAYRCVRGCSEAADVRRVPALSRVAGSLASGAASELWSPGREVSGSRVLRGFGSAYASTFVSALVTEFQPELNAFGNRLIRGVFGGR